MCCSSATATKYRSRARSITIPIRYQFWHFHTIAHLLAGPTMGRSRMKRNFHMPMHRRTFLNLLAAAAVYPAYSSAAFANDYPSRPIRLLVGFPEGGPVDIAARTIAGWLAGKLAQPVVIDNQPGESGNKATRL